ncbi:MAG: hypothetical protein J0H71_20815 [Rhizobiales bacterium]|nr:hypothetical protein [Hyphomicrobiales bacterium]
MILPSNEMPKRFVSLYPFDPTVSHLLKFSLFDVFFNYDSNETYAGPLWTMSFELIGSFMVVALAFTIKWKYYWPFVCVLIGLFLVMNPWYALFVIGSALARCFDFIECQSNVGGTLMMILGAALSLYLPGNTALVVGSSLFFAGVILCEPATKFFSNSFGRFLGWISFPLYLAHAPIIFAVGMPIYLWANNSPWLMFLAGMCTAAVSVGLAIAMVPVNDLAMALSRAFGKHFETTIVKQFSAIHR